MFYSNKIFGSFRIEKNGFIIINDAIIYKAEKCIFGIIKYDLNNWAIIHMPSEILLPFFFTSKIKAEVILNQIKDNLLWCTPEFSSIKNEIISEFFKILKENS